MKKEAMKLTQKGSENKYLELNSRKEHINNLRALQYIGNFDGMGCRI
jgi:hypothetical protein